MSASSPDPRYWKDGLGLRPRHLRFLLRFGPRKWFWHTQPRWLLKWRVSRKDAEARSKR